MRIKIISACLLVIISLTSCAEESLLGGRLVYGLANYVYAFDTTTQRTELLYEAPYGEIVGDLTVVDEDRILFSSHRRKSDIIELNLKTRTEKKVHKGSHPAYIRKHGMLFFYDRPEGATHTRLYVGRLDDLLGSLHEVDEGPFVLAQQVIQVSHDEVVFSSGRDGGSQNVWMYNIVTEKLNQLPLRNCRPKIWRAATKQLLCTDLSTGHRFFSNLEGHKGDDYPDGNLSPIVYIPSRDLLVVARARFFAFSGEVTDFVVHNIKTDKESVLLKEGAGPLGSAVWFSHQY